MDIILASDGCCAIYVCNDNFSGPFLVGRKRDSAWTPGFMANRHPRLDYIMYSFMIHLSSFGNDDEVEYSILIKFFCLLSSKFCFHVIVHVTCISWMGPKTLCNLQLLILVSVSYINSYKRILICTESRPITAQVQQIADKRTSHLNP